MGGVKVTGHRAQGISILMYFQPMIFPFGDSNYHGVISGNLRVRKLRLEIRFRPFIIGLKDKTISMSGRYICVMSSLPGETNLEGSFKNKTASFLQWRKNNKYTFHFIALLVFLSVLPLLEDSEVARIFTDVTLVILLFFAVQAISHEIYLMIFGLFLVGITIVLYTLFYLTNIVHYFNGAIVVTLVFFIMVSIAIFVTVIREREIRRDTIFGAISVYFLLGLTWAMAIMAMGIFSPGSFNISSHKT